MQKRNSIFLCFKNDLTAPQAADICGVNRNTANRYYGLLRRAILSESIHEARWEIGEYELDESCFGARGEKQNLQPQSPEPCPAGKPFQRGKLGRKKRAFGNVFFKA